jgi:hypothetical protein
VAGGHDPLELAWEDPVPEPTDPTEPKLPEDDEDDVEAFDEVVALVLAFAVAFAFALAADVVDELEELDDGVEELDAEPVVEPVPVELWLAAVAAPWSCARCRPRAVLTAVPASIAPVVHLRAVVSGWVRRVIAGSFPGRGSCPCPHRGGAPCVVAVVAMGVLSRPRERSAEPH